MLDHRALLTVGGGAFSWGASSETRWGHREDRGADGEMRLWIFLEERRCLLSPWAPAAISLRDTELTCDVTLVSGAQLVIRHLHTSRSDHGHQDRRPRAEVGLLTLTLAAGSPCVSASWDRVSSLKSVRRRCALADGTGVPVGPPVCSHGPAVRPWATA